MAEWENVGKIQGDKGEKGDKGDKGDQGERGLDGSSLSTHVELLLSSPQIISSGGWHTLTELESRGDVDDLFNSVESGIQIKKAGYYQLYFSCSLKVGMSSNVDFKVNFRLKDQSGKELVTSPSYSSGNSGNVSNKNKCYNNTAIYYLRVDDIITMDVNQNSGDEIEVMTAGNSTRFGLFSLGVE